MNNINNIIEAHYESLEFDDFQYPNFYYRFKIINETKEEYNAKTI